MQHGGSPSTPYKTLTVRVPLAYRKRGGRRLVLAPGGSSSGVARLPRIDSTIVKAIARAFRWKRLLDVGRYGSVLELAQAEEVNPSYMCRVLRLTLLAPDIVEAVLGGKQPPEVQLDALLMPHPAAWSAQRERLVASDNSP